jgi:hypothetical protein
MEGRSKVPVKAEVSAMAGSLTIGKGASPLYYTEQVSRGTDYYSAAAGSERPGSEPEGIWTGDGCSNLALEIGAEVDHKSFGLIFGSHIDPRDGSKIGRAMRHRDAEEIYCDLLDAEPGATAERRAELFAQAQAVAERSRPVAFLDATFSVSKSITLLHASARAMKLTAQESNDPETAEERRHSKTQSGKQLAPAQPREWRTCKSMPDSPGPARKASGTRTLTGGWWLAGGSTPAGPATRSCTFTRRSSTGCAPTATASGGR